MLFRSKAHACFVMRNTTYFLQPLDLMYMRSWKSQMRQYVSRHMAAQVLEDGVLPTGLTKSKAELRIDLTQAVAMATTAVAGNGRLRTKEWEHLVMEGTQLDAILWAAEQLHAAEDLFGKDELEADDHVEIFALQHEEEEDIPAGNAAPCRTHVVGSRRGLGSVVAYRA